MPGRLVRRLHLDGIPGRLWLQTLLVFAVVTTLVLSCVATVVLLKNSQAAKRDRLVQSAALRLLVECTTPPDQRKPPELHAPATDCYVRNQAASASVIGEPKAPINTVSILAASCGAAHPGDGPATLACVLKGLKP